MKRYREKTKSDLFAHPIAADLQNCERPSDILAVLHKNHDVQEFIQFQSDDKTSEQWLNATFTVVASFSDALGKGIGLVSVKGQVVNHQPSNTCFPGILTRKSHLCRNRCPSHSGYFP